MRCGQRRTKPLDEEKHWNFFLVCTWNRCDIEDEGVARREETRPCASRHPVHVYIVYISSRRPCPDLAPFLARRKRMEHRLSHERRAGYKGTAGPPLNTPSAGSLAPRHENSCVFPPSLLVRPLRQSGVRYGVGRRCQKKLQRAESGRAAVRDSCGRVRLYGWSTTLTLSHSHRRGNEQGQEIRARRPRGERSARTNDI